MHLDLSVTEKLDDHARDSAPAPQPASAAPKPEFIVLDDEEGTERSEPLRVPAQLGHYRVVRQLGAGGMGVVLLAVDDRTGAEVAVKVMQPRYSAEPNRRRDFLKEARAMKAMSHPNIVRVLHIEEGSREGAATDLALQPFYVMPYIGGGSIEGKVRPGRHVNLAKLLPVAQQIAEALEYAHDGHGVVHRDLKPANVLLDDDDHPYLCDFGLARSMLDSNSIALPARRKSWTVGTWPYMAPEVIQGKAGDYRVDIYSLGAMLYEFCAGQRPYLGSTPDEIFAAVKAGPPPLLAEVNAALAKEAPEWIIVVESAMARELDERYAHVKYMKQDLARMALGQRPLGSRRVAQARAMPSPPPPFPGRAAVAARAGRRPVRTALWVGAAGCAALAISSLAFVSLRSCSGSPGPGPRPPTVVPSEPRSDATSSTIRALNEAIRAESPDLRSLIGATMKAVGRSGLSAPTIDGEINPALLAVDLGRLGPLVILHDAGWPIGVADAQGRTPVLRAAMAEHWPALDRLVEWKIGSLDDAVPATGEMAIHLAAKAGAVNAVRRLLDAGMSPGARTIGSWTPLMYASEQGHLDVVELLALAARDHINDVNNNGMTALHFAASSGEAQVCARLLVLGADARVTTKGGETAADIARRKRHNALADILSRG